MFKLFVVLCLVTLLGVGQGEDPEGDEPLCTGDDGTIEASKQGVIDRLIQRFQGKPAGRVIVGIIKRQLKNKNSPLRRLMGNAATDPSDPSDTAGGEPTGNINMPLMNFLGKFIGQTKTVVGYLWSYGFIAKVLNKSKKEADNYNGVIPPCAVTNAVKAFQLFNQLEPDGILTKETRDLMAKDRCGNPDVKCTTRACKLKDRYNTGASRVLRKKRYAVRRKKWKISRRGKYVIGYYFENMYNPDAADKFRHDKTMTPDVVRAEVEKGLKEWTEYSGLTFVEVDNAKKAHVTIKFGSGAHGEKNARQYFDGRYGVLAHMYYPRNGRMHFDEAENFTASNQGPGINLHFVVAHEGGHGLGIEHSTVPGALMGPYYRGFKEKMLEEDDIMAVRNLYGIGSGKIYPLKGGYVDREGEEGSSGGSSSGGSAENIEDESGEDGDDTGETDQTSGGEEGDDEEFDNTSDRTGCIEHFSAGFSDANEDYIYLFYNENNYLRLEPKAEGHRAFPVVSETGGKFSEMLISDKFPGLVGPYDAAVTDDKSKVTYLFAEGTVTTWDWSTNQIGELNKEPIENTVFADLPEADIKAVARHDDVFLFFTDDRYYVYSIEDGVLDPEGHPGPEDGEEVASAFNSFFDGYIYTTRADHMDNNVYDLLKAKRITTGGESVAEFEDAIMAGYGSIDIDDDTMFGWPASLEFCQDELTWEV